MTNAHRPSERVAWFRGARKAASKIGRKMVPAMPVPEPQDDFVKREAYQLALVNRKRKPWARRYLREIARGFYVR